MPFTVNDPQDLQRRIDARLGSIEDQLGTIERWVLQQHYSERAHAYFASFLRHVRLVDPADLDELLDDAIDAGQITQDEREAVLLADLVVSGRDRATQEEAHLLVEVSAGIGLRDVT